MSILTRQGLGQLLCLLAGLVAGCQPDGGDGGGATGGSSGRGGHAGGVSSGGTAGGSRSGGMAGTSAAGGSGGLGAGSATGGSAGGAAMTGGNGAGGGGTGGAAGSPGSSGNGGNGGSGGSGATDAAAETGGASEGGGTASSCAKPNIDDYTQWIATSEGQMIPASGSILVKEGAAWAGKVEFVGGGWHVLVMYTANKYEAQSDLGRSKGFTLTYSATSDFYVQLRPAQYWSGGDKWVTLLPSTGGQRTTRFFSFAPESWTTLAALGKPNYPLATALAQVRGFVFVGNGPNKITFHALDVDGYRPVCN
jgi:hypothetical protein